MVLGKNIKSVRKKKGIKQSELAHELGITVRTIQNYESGNREPNMETLMKICDILGCAPMDIIPFQDFEKNYIGTLDESKKRIDFAAKMLNEYPTRTNTTQNDIKKALHEIVSDIVAVSIKGHDLEYDSTDFSQNELNEISVFLYNAYTLKINEILKRHENLNPKEGE
jgi:transcriptional regulator with XRE-family HTH domain